MIGFFDDLKSTIASRTSCTFAHSAAVPVGRMMTLVMRRSTFALRSDSTTERTVGGGSKNDPTSPPGSASWRSPPTRRTSVEFDATDGWRPISSAVNTRPAAETATAMVTKMTTSQTPRLPATGTSPGTAFPANPSIISHAR